MSRPLYEYLPHPADIRFKAFGNTLEELFEHAALAMFNVMIDTTGLEPAKTYDIALESQAPDDLMYDYLSELLYLFEVEETIFGYFQVDKINIYDNGYSLIGRVQGESMDPARHSFETEVKAVTYHQLKVIKDDQGYCAHVILDV